jgi:hypothetical protein
MTPSQLAAIWLHAQVNYYQCLSLGYKVAAQLWDNERQKALQLWAKLYPGSESW